MRTSDTLLAQVRRAARTLQTLRRDESGQDLVEYGFLAGFISLAAILSISSLGGNVATTYGSVNTSLTKATGTRGTTGTSGSAPATPAASDALTGKAATPATGAESGTAAPATGAGTDAAAAEDGQPQRAGKPSTTVPADR